MEEVILSGSFNEDEYNELLQQAVAVIESSRLHIAKQLNTVVMSSYWETELSKTQFANAFGDKAYPKYGDFIYIPMMQRMWDVNAAYDEKNEFLSVIIGQV